MIKKFLIKRFLTTEKIVAEKLDIDSSGTTIDYTRPTPNITAYNPITGRKRINQ